MDQLHVVAARANPLRWKTPDKIYQEWAQHILDSGAKLTVIECQYGERGFTAAFPGVNHIGVRASTMCWSKENLLNLAIARLPDAKYICWSDSDVFFREARWVDETLHALQLYGIVQPWVQALDLGPHGEIMQLHQSFCFQFHKLGSAGVIPSAPKMWKFNGGPYDYPHSGYCWAATRQALDWLGGLFEVGGMGSGDHHMALGLVGGAEKSLPGKVSSSYRDAVMRWQARAMQHINGNIGFVPGVIEHRFHGRKADRKYIDRWDMFMDHGFDPVTDLKKNTYGVIEWAGNKPELRREFDNYLRSRNEDINSL